VPGFIPEHKIAEIQRSIDIVELISGYMPLKRVGTRYKALCPFHHEKTPSFVVSPERQIFKCFGCNVGGDAFKFIMLKEHVEFPEAVRMLAERVGIAVTAEGASAREERAPLYEANAWAAALFQKNLKESPEAAFAREYLTRRRISPEMIEKFRLGYAARALKPYLDAAAQAKLSTEVLERAGLLRRRSSDNELAAAFRNRLIFPIADGRQRMIAFGARALSDEDVPKYLNSPETPLFSKSRTLYGIGEAKEAILKQRRVAIMEGYTDVIMAHQFGIEWAVAVLGTALTQEHLRELRRYADEVILVFDADTAGKKSSDRSLDIFVEEEMPVRIATLAEGEDPCDYLLNHGAERFLEMLNKGQDLIAYKMDAALAGMENATPWQKAQALDDVLQTIARTPNPVTRDMMVKQVAARSGVREAAVHERLSKMRAPRENRGGDGKPPSDSTNDPQGPPKAVQKAQAEALESLLSKNDLIRGLQAEDFLGHFVSPVFRAVAECVIKTYSELGQATEQDVLARLADPEARDAVVQVIDLEPTQKNYAEQLAGALRFLRKVQTDSEAGEVTARMLASDAGQKNAFLSEYLEKAKRTRKGPEAFLKGLNKTKRTEAKLDGQN
jgi:DNA primase